MDRRDISLFALALTIIIMGYIILGDSYGAMVVTAMTVVAYLSVSLSSYLKSMGFWRRGGEEKEPPLSLYVDHSLKRGVVDIYLRSVLMNLAKDRLRVLHDLYSEDLDEYFYNKKLIERYKIPRRLAEILTKEEMSIDEYIEALDILERWV